MNFVPRHNGSSYSDGAEDLGQGTGRKESPASFYPPRRITGALLTSMSLEYIKPEAVAVKWRNIHNSKS